MATKNKKRKAQKTRQRKAEKRRKSRQQKGAEPVRTLTANGLKRLIKQVDLKACGLTDSFRQGVARLGERLEKALSEPWSLATAWGYPELTALRAELEEEILSEEIVDRFLQALEKEAQGRRAYGALMSGLQNEAYIDLLWREVFAELSADLEGDEARRAALFLPDYCPDVALEPTPLEALAEELEVSKATLEKLQERMASHPALLRLAELTTHMQARARFSALAPLLGEEQASRYAARMQVGWAREHAPESLRKRFQVLLRLEPAEVEKALAVLGSTFRGCEPVDPGTWSELQTDPGSPFVALSLAAQQLSLNPDETVALLSFCGEAPSCELRRDELMASACIALDRPAEVEKAARTALQRLPQMELPQEMDRSVPASFFSRFLCWLSKEHGSVDWQAATEGVPTQSLESARGAREGLANFRQGLESGYYLGWEAMIRAEQDLPLSPMMETFRENVTEEEGRLEFIDGVARPARSWSTEFTELVAAACREGHDLSEPGPHFWPELATVVRERAVELDNPRGLCDPVKALDLKTRFHLDRAQCLAEMDNTGAAGVFSRLIQLRASVVESMASLDDFLSPVKGDEVGELRRCFSEWLALEDGVALWERLRLFDIELP